MDFSTIDDGNEVAAVGRRHGAEKYVTSVARFFGVRDPRRFIRTAKDDAICGAAKSMEANDVALGDRSAGLARRFGAVTAIVKAATIRRPADGCPIGNARNEIGKIKSRLHAEDVPSKRLDSSNRRGVCEL